VVKKEFNQVRLCAGGIQIDLVANGLVAGVAHDIGQELRIEIRDTDSFGEAFVDETLEAGPKNVHGYLWLSKEIVRPVQVVQVHVVGLE
jgi:hypothetical protein